MWLYGFAACHAFQRSRFENAAQGCIYNCAVVSSEPEVLYACSADGKVCQLEDRESTGTHITASFESDTVLTQLCLPPGLVAQCFQPNCLQHC